MDAIKEHHALPSATAVVEFAINYVFKEIKPMENSIDTSLMSLEEYIQSHEAWEGKRRGDLFIEFAKRGDAQVRERLGEYLNEADPDDYPYGLDPFEEFITDARFHFAEAFAEAKFGLEEVCFYRFDQEFTAPYFSDINPYDAYLEYAQGGALCRYIGQGKGARVCLLSPGHRPSATELMDRGREWGVEVEIFYREDESVALPERIDTFDEAIASIDFLSRYAPPRVSGTTQMTPSGIHVFKDQ
tara:strand:+ start:2224 stop:2955 length:732 start_codon:yes stop_codon:yes gene_type:complete